MADQFLQVGLVDSTLTINYNGSLLIDSTSTVATTSPTMRRRALTQAAGSFIDIGGR